MVDFSRQAGVQMVHGQDTGCQTLLAVEETGGLGGQTGRRLDKPGAEVKRCEEGHPSSFPGLLCPDGHPFPFPGLLCPRSRFPFVLY